MKKMTKVLLVICSLILCLGLCGCTEIEETAETTVSYYYKPFWNKEEIDGITHVSTNDTYEYYKLHKKLESGENYEIIEEKETRDADTKERVCEIWYRVYPVEKISRYFTRAYESYEDYKADSVLEEELEAGKYEIWGEIIDSSGKYELVLKETFEAMQTKEAEDEYTFTVNEDDGYLTIVRWVVEELGYEIVDINVDDSDDELTYDITYKKTEATPEIPTSDAEYMYAAAKCTAEDSEERRAEFLEMGYEIISETNLSENGAYLFTYRIPMQ